MEIAVIPDSMELGCGFSSADAACVLHTHSDASVAVSGQEKGLLPLSQMAMHFYGALGYVERYRRYVAEEIEPGMRAIAPETGVTIELATVTAPFITDHLASSSEFGTSR